MQLRMKTGSEGPAFDPYAYHERSVIYPDGTEIMAHTGLAEYIEISHKDKVLVRVDQRWNQDGLVDNTFKGITDMDLGDFDDYYHRIHHTCKKCGHYGTEDVNGYPGETLNICTRCGEIVSSDFNESAII